MRGLRIVAAVAVAVILGTGAVLPAAVPAAADNDGWDPRLAEVAHAVEDIRGLEFDHPVPVEQLSDKEFKREVAGGKITADDRLYWTRSTQTLMALGLIDHPVELEAVQDDAGDFYGGYYDSDRKAIVVRKEKLTTPAMRALLAHELTHALQDQRFGFGAVDRRSRRSDVPRAIVEGDADNVATLYIEQKLTDAEREKVYSLGDEGDGELEDDGGPSMPLFFELQRTEPYRLGSQMVWLLEATGNARAIDRALRKPPVDDVAFLDPRALLDPARIATVPKPEIEATELRQGRAFDLAPDVFYFMLATRMPPSAALNAAERWGGGRYQLFRDQATPCVRASVVGRNGREDAAVIADALRAWGAGRPEMRGAEIDGDTVTFTTCVPEGSPPAVSDAALAQAFEHVSLRYELADAGIRQHKSVDEAICTADELLARPSVTGPLGTITVFGDQYPAELVSVLRTAFDDLVTPPACR